MGEILQNNFRGDVLHNNFRGDVLHNNLLGTEGIPIRIPEEGNINSDKVEKKNPNKSLMIIGGLIILGFLVIPVLK